MIWLSLLCVPAIIWDTTRKEAEKNVEKENIMEFH
jgi:hypothetical protein